MKHLVHVFLFLMVLAGGFFQSVPGYAQEVLYHMALVRHSEIQGRQFAIRFMAPKVYLTCLNSGEPNHSLEVLQNTLNIKIGSAGIYGVNDEREVCQATHQRVKKIITLDAALLESYDISVIRFQNGNNFDRYKLIFAEDYVEFQPIDIKRIVPDFNFHKHRDPLKYYFYPTKTIVLELVDDVSPEAIEAVANWGEKYGLIPLEKFNPRVKLPAHIKDKFYFVDQDETYLRRLPQEGYEFFEIDIDTGTDLGRYPDVPRYSTIGVNLRKPGNND